MGISHCEGTQFVCNDGSYSRSTKDCSESFLTKIPTPKSATLIENKPSAFTENRATSPFMQSPRERERSRNILKLDYPGFTIWLDCEKHGAVKFQYVAQHDTGNAKRYPRFYLDPDRRASCRERV